MFLYLRNIFLSEAKGESGDWEWEGGGIGDFAKFSGKKRRSFYPPTREKAETVKFTR